MSLSLIASALLGPLILSPGGGDDPDPWGGARVELQWIAQPDQTRAETCDPRRDCFSTTRHFQAAALRAGWVTSDAWGLELTFAAGHARDWERRPETGFGVFSLQADLTIEITRTRDDFGFALRISPVLLYGWSGTGSDLRTDFPGLALLFGWRDLWGEVALPAHPTHADPRGFQIAGGWRDDSLMLGAGVGTFGSLAYADDKLRKHGAFFGVWLESRVRLIGGLELSARLTLSSPSVLSLGLAYAPSRASVPGLLD